VIVPAPRELGDTTQYFAVSVVDDSLDAVYPPGATLLVRRLGSVDLKIGDLVIARCFGCNGETVEVLTGTVGYSRTSEVVLSTKSHNPEIPASVPVRPAAANNGLGEVRCDFNSGGSMQVVEGRHQSVVHPLIVQTSRNLEFV